MLIYKIMSESDFDIFKKKGVFLGAEVDITDGYIHFSTRDQVKETAAKHFSGQNNLYLVWTNSKLFKNNLKWEISRKNQTFPHLYQAWHYKEVVGSCKLPLISDQHMFPDKL